MSIKFGGAVLLLLIGFHAGAQFSYKIDSIRNVILNKPSNQAFYDLAETYANSGQPDSSIAILTRRLPFETRKFKISSLHQILGWLYINKGLYSIAEKETLIGIKIALEINDSILVADNYNNLSSIAHLNGLDSVALMYGRKAVTFAPQASWSAMSLGYSLINLKGYYEAIGIFQRLARHPDDDFTAMESHYFLAECFLNVKAYDSALFHINYFRKLVNSFPRYQADLQYSYWLKGRYFMQRGNSFLARSEFRRALASKMPRSVHLFDDWNSKIMPSLYSDLIQLYQDENRGDSALYFLKQQLVVTQQFLAASKQTAAGFQLTGVDEQVRVFISEKDKERESRLQYLFITLILFLLAGIYFVSAGLTNARKFGPYFSAFVLIVAFEFILVLLDPLLSKWAGDNTLYKFLINVLIAIVLIPLHKSIEKILGRFALIIRWKKVQE